MAFVKVPTNFNIELEFEIPEFHRRLFAWLIDLFIQIFYMIIAHRLLIGYYINRESIDINDMYDFEGLRLMIMLPVFMYHLVSEITMNGQSIGKKIMRLQVVNEIGGKPGISQFIIRWLIRTSDYMILLILVYNVFILMDPNAAWFMLAFLMLFITDLIMVGSSKKGQRLGDLLARTIVIRRKTSGSVEDTVFLEVADNYVPSYPEIMRLSDRDINSLKGILDTARKQGDFHMAAAASEKIKYHLNIKSSLEPFEFLDTLLRDYNYLSVK